MQKISSEKVAQVLRDAAAAVTSMAAERDAMAVKLASIEQRIECEKLARAMQEKGIRVDEELDTLTADLEKEASAGKLGEIQRAVDMVTPDMSFAREAPNHDLAAGSGSMFEDFIIGNLS